MSGSAPPVGDEAGRNARTHYRPESMHSVRLLPLGEMHDKDSDYEWLICKVVVSHQRSGDHMSGACKTRVLIIAPG